MNEDDNLVIVETFGRPLSASWTPVSMQLLKEDARGRRRRKADMPWMGAHLLIMKPKAIEVLRDLCLQAGELLALNCEDTELVAWNVTTTLDALDERRSKIIRFPDGGVMDIKAYSFRPDIIEGHIAFRIPQDRATIFVSPGFVERARATSLTGTEFEEVWAVD